MKDLRIRVLENVIYKDRRYSVGQNYTVPAETAYALGSSVEILGEVPTSQEVQTKPVQAPRTAVMQPKGVPAKRAGKRRRSGSKK